MAAELRQLQLCILDVALEFKRICEKYDINYFLIGGSLLGAVRHKGFIPWDDDMDVGMLREDYEKFLSICKDELSDDFFLQDYKTDEYYAFGYAKIRIKGTEFAEDYNEHSKQGRGIFLDIFPLDDMPDGKIKQKLHYLLFKCVKWAALGKADYAFTDAKKHRFAKIMSTVFFPFSRRKLLKIEDQVCAMFRSKNSEYAINLQGAYNYREYVKKDNLNRTDTLLFEGYEFSAPTNYSDYLTQIYGDYMTPPPIEKRGKQHLVVGIKIGDYKIKNNAKLRAEVPIGEAVNESADVKETVDALMQRDKKSELPKSALDLSFEHTVVTNRKGLDMKRVITYGTFDLLHYGHINLLKRAKALGDYLVVVLSTDEFNWNEKHKKCYFTYEQRKALLESIRYVDLVIPETNWEQKKTDVHEYHIDTFVMGDDWKGKFDFLKDEGVEVVYLPRTPEISTTQIKQDLNAKIAQNERGGVHGSKLIRYIPANTYGIESETAA